MTVEPLSRRPAISVLIEPPARTTSIVSLFHAHKDNPPEPDAQVLLVSLGRSPADLVEEWIHRYDTSLERMILLYPDQLTVDEEFDSQYAATVSPHITTATFDRSDPETLSRTVTERTRARRTPEDSILACCEPLTPFILDHDRDTIADLFDTLDTLATAIPANWYVHLQPVGLSIQDRTFLVDLMDELEVSYDPAGMVVVDKDGTVDSPRR